MDVTYFFVAGAICAWLALWLSRMLRGSDKRWLWTGIIWVILMILSYIPIRQISP